MSHGNGIDRFVVNYNKSSKINIIAHSKLQSINMSTSKLEFYNPEINEPLHKFWYYIPNAKLIEKKNTGAMRIALSNIDVNLTESLKSLDGKTDEIIINVFKKPKPETTIKTSVNFPPVIDLYIDRLGKCFDQNNDPIKYMDIKNNARVQLYMELDSIHINVNKNSCDRKWRILQISELKPLNLFDEINQLNSQPDPASSGGSNIPPAPPLTETFETASSYIPNAPGVNGGIYGINPINGMNNVYGMNMMGSMNPMNSMNSMNPMMNPMNPMIQMNPMNQMNQMYPMGINGMNMMNGMIGGIGGMNPMGGMNMMNGINGMMNGMMNGYNGVNNMYNNQAQMMYPHNVYQPDNPVYAQTNNSYQHKIPRYNEHASQQPSEHHNIPSAPSAPPTPPAPPLLFNERSSISSAPSLSIPGSSKTNSLAINDLNEKNNCPVFQPPTQDQLLDMLSQLKKTKINDKPLKKYVGVEANNIKPTPSCPPVALVEPLVEPPVEPPVAPPFGPLVGPLVDDSLNSVDEKRNEMSNDNISIKATEVQNNDNQKETNDNHLIELSKKIMRSIQ
jgi:hypothetical protein